MLKIRRIFALVAFAVLAFESSQTVALIRTMNPKKMRAPAA